MTRKILAITGRLQSGKSTLAHLLETRHGYKICDFADPLKQMIAALLRLQGMTEDDIYERLYGSKKELPCPELSGRSARHAMQTLGTEWRDLIDTNLWVDVWRHRIENLSKVVVADMRFPHELDQVRSLGGKVISIIRGEDSTFASLHNSEQHIARLTADADLVIVNDMTPNDMLRQVQNFFGDWL
jgi:hypothetical protein